MKCFSLLLLQASFFKIPSCFWVSRIVSGWWRLNDVSDFPTTTQTSPIYIRTNVSSSSECLGAFLVSDI